MKDRESEITELWLKYLEESKTNKALTPVEYLKRYPEYQEELKPLLNLTEAGQIIVQQDVSKLTERMKEDIWQKVQKKQAQDYLDQASETFAKNNFVSTRELLDKSVAIHQKSGNNLWLGFEYSIIGFMAHLEDKFSEAIECYKKSSQYYQKAGEIKGQASSLAYLALVYFENEDYDKAWQFFEKAVDLSTKINYLEGMTGSASYLGIIELSRGNHRQSFSWHQKALVSAERLGNKGEMSAAYHNMAEAAQSGRGHKTAIELYHKALAISRAEKNYELIANGAGSLGALYASHNKWDEASMCFNEAANAVDQIKGSSTHPTALKFRRTLGSLGLPSVQEVFSGLRAREKQVSLGSVK